jgi:IclR family acetate operon transcriptional repressor
MVTGSSSDRQPDDVPAPGGVQSLHRALDLLEVVASHGGQMAIGEIAAVSKLPLPTIHRLLRTLVERGYMRQLPSRRYAIGFRLIPLAATANALVGADTGATLAHLVAELGETANLAVLSGDSAEYVAQAPSPHSMRMFTEIGRRVRLHSTGVGKALLSRMEDDEVSAIIRRVGLPAQTEHSIVTENRLRAALAEIRQRGYAIDEEEQELGVRCIAVSITGQYISPMAVSVSGPVSRVTDDFVTRAVPLLQNAAQEIGAELGTGF